MANMTIREAAEALDVSVDTVRRRIKDNKVKAWKEEGKYGQQWVIDSNSLVEYQHIIETVPVKYNMSPDVLIDNIKTSVKDATDKAIKEGTIEAMHNYKNLKEQMLQDKQDLQIKLDRLEKQNETLLELLQGKKSKTLLDKFKELFK